MAARHKYRLKCQTINKQNKLPCKAKGYLTKKGTIRCRLHGGYSTGPKSVEGKIKALKKVGLEVLEEVSKSGYKGQKVVFLHPKSTNGVLIELVEEGIS